MGKVLTEQERKEREQQVKVALAKSNKLVKDFKIYLGVFESNTMHQTSRLTKEEYEKMQNKKFIGSKHEEHFFNNIPDSDQYVEAKTFVIDRTNFAMAFHMMIWQVLTLEEKIAACRIAWKELLNKDVKDFNNYDSSAVVLVGKKYKGALNLGSLFKEELFSSDILCAICNAENIIKLSYYYNHRKKEYKTLLDFDSFEELRYLSPLEPKVSIDLMKDDVAKAVCLDNLFYRNDRNAQKRAYYLLTSHCEPIYDLFPQFDRYIHYKLESIVNTSLFIAKNLGANLLERDEKYLRLKADMFDSINTKLYNEKVAEYQKLYLEYKNAQDAISEAIFKEQLLKEHSKLMELKKKLFVDYEVVKKHFASHFEDDKKTTKKLQKSLFNKHKQSIDENQLN